MRLLAVCLSLVVASCAGVELRELPESNFAKAHEHLRGAWNEFKQEYWQQQQQQQQDDVHGEMERFLIFSDNYLKALQHNRQYEQGHLTYAIGINQFSDRTQAEMAAMFERSKVELEKATSKHYSVKHQGADLSQTPTPSSFDWRSEAPWAELPARLQGSCGTCWAMAASQGIEYMYNIRRNTSAPLRLSVQQYVDCVYSQPNLGKCYGGSSYDALNYTAIYGVMTEADYPYLFKPGDSCKYDASKVAVKLSGTGYVDLVPCTNEEVLKAAIATIGPLMVSMDATEGQFPMYRNGIYQTPVSKLAVAINLNHVAILLGYGSENGIDYWIGKNSWGASWGENGYFRVRRNNPAVPLNLGIGLQAAYATL